MSYLEIEVDWPDGDTVRDVESRAKEEFWEAFAKIRQNNYPILEEEQPQ